MILQDVLQDARQRLREIETSSLDARLLIQDVLDMSHSEIISQPDRVISKEQFKVINGFIERRAAGEPVSKILGHKEFYGRRFYVTSDTLDPRPETELLINRVLLWAKDKEQPLSILDLGTGTGCIPITLIKEIPNVQAIACDVSTKALEIAQKNAEQHCIANSITFVQSNWFENIDGQFDIITSNPPYIPNPEIESLSKEVRNHDPILALDGGADGYDAYKKIFSSLKKYLKPDGQAFFEIGFAQGENIARLVDDSDLYMVGILPDIAGIARVVEISYGEK